jgi:hypothetical protein
MRNARLNLRAVNAAGHRTGHVWKSKREGFGYCVALIKRGILEALFFAIYASKEAWRSQRQLVTPTLGNVMLVGGWMIRLREASVLNAEHECNAHFDVLGQKVRHLRQNFCCATGQGRMARNVSGGGQGFQVKNEHMATVNKIRCVHGGAICGK